MIRLVRPTALVLLAASVVLACSGGPAVGSASSAPASASSATASASAPAPASASPAPSASAGDGSGGAVGGNPGSGLTPVPIPPGGPGQSGGRLPSPSPTEVQRVAGLLSVHDVHATAVEANVSNGHLIARVFWWSGPPPCSALAGVSVELAISTFTLTVEEGAQQLGVACPALAMYKVTTVDLGPVSPGTYTVKALGVDPGITVSYSG